VDKIVMYEELSLRKKRIMGKYFRVAIVLLQKWRNVRIFDDFKPKTMLFCIIPGKIRTFLPI